MAGALALLASAVAPSLFLLWFFSSRDLYPEPAKKVWKAFWSGLLAMLLSLAAALPIQYLLPTAQEIGPSLYGLLDAFLSAAIPEECAKFLVLLRFCKKTKDCDEPMDCMVYGAAASLGFACLENILYVQDGGLSLAVARAVSAVPSHAMDGALMGYFMGRALFDPGPAAPRYLLALLVPILFHGIYDFGPLTLTAYGEIGIEVPMLTGLPLAALAAGTLIFQATLTTALVRRLRREQRRAEPSPATLSPGPPPRAPGAWIALGLGTLLLCAVALFNLLLFLGTLQEGLAAGELPDLILGWAALCLVPLALGGWLFLFGLRRLKKRRGT